jgi:hypothetical protein
MDGNGHGRPRAFSARESTAAASALRRRCARPAISASHFSDLLVQRGELDKAASRIRELVGLLRRFLRHDLADPIATGCACGSSASARTSTI